MNPSDQTLEPAKRPTRLLSIDALRGFDMFWIIGGDALVVAVARYADWPFKDKVIGQFEHVEWDGFVFYDLIFPLFLFLVGVVIPFSLGQHGASGVPKATVYGRIVRRTALLFLLGLVNNGLLQLNWLKFDPTLRVDFSEFAFAGVLQRIAIAYFFAAMIVVHTRLRGQIVACILILVGYWAVLSFVPVPANDPTRAGMTPVPIGPPATVTPGLAERYSKAGNLAGYVDRRWLPGAILKQYYEYGANEGLLSTIPAVATALLGVFAGRWLRTEKSAGTKFLGLAGAGVVCLAAGSAWGLQFPVVKNLWTSSFVLVAGGWSLILLAAFYGVIDGLKFRRWAFFFVVIGANAITIYVGKEIVDFPHTAEFFLGGIARHTLSFAPVLLAAGTLAAEWVVLWYLYRQKLFLRV